MNATPAHSEAEAAQQSDVVAAELQQFKLQLGREQPSARCRLSPFHEPAACKRHICSAGRSMCTKWVSAGSESSCRATWGQSVRPSRSSSLPRSRASSSLAPTKVV
ncbi:hypothetical protein C8Q74DRAFT_1251156 [Fomes fomentarius]|nr:hypothetical protein C8Q74DRAFT_1251156 [Fomes fomentarius]